MQCDGDVGREQLIFERHVISCNTTYVTCAQSSDTLGSSIFTEIVV